MENMENIEMISPRGTVVAKAGPTCTGKGLASVSKNAPPETIVAIFGGIVLLSATLLTGAAFMPSENAIVPVDLHLIFVIQVLIVVGLVAMTPVICGHDTMLKEHLRIKDKPADSYKTQIKDLVQPVLIALSNVAIFGTSWSTMMYSGLLDLDGSIGAFLSTYFSAFVITVVISLASSSYYAYSGIESSIERSYTTAKPDTLAMYYMTHCNKNQCYLSQTVVPSSTTSGSAVKFSIFQQGSDNASAYRKGAVVFGVLYQAFVASASILSAAYLYRTLMETGMQAEIAECSSMILCAVLMFLFLPLSHRVIKDILDGGAAMDAREIGTHAVKVIKHRNGGEEIDGEEIVNLISN